MVSILNILGTFRVGGLSKKDTLVAIRLTLGDQADLKQDLLNILFHREADWGVGDFDFGSHQPSSQTSPSPQFLQPVHQPQMRLPPISPSWYDERHSCPSNHLTGVVGSGNDGNFGMPVSSSLHQLPSRFCRPNLFTSPVLTDSARLDSHKEGIYGVKDSPAKKQHDVEVIPHLGRSQHEWEDADHLGGERSFRFKVLYAVANVLTEPKAYYGQPWSPVASNSMLGRTQSFARNHFDSPAPSYENHLSSNSSSSNGQIAAISPSVLGVPVAVPIGQPINDMPPPSKKRRRQSSRPQVKVKKETSQEDTETASPTPSSITTIDQLSVQPQLKKRKVQDEYTISHAGEGPYIHSLCGKGFSSRSRIKKHHWGNKLDDLGTTTGCWAKNNKPNVSWNEHPSCKRGVVPPRPVKKALPAVPKQRTMTQKAPMAPSMVPKSQDLSPTVSDTPHAHQENQHSFEGLGSYHTHRLLTGTSFDNLLTAVNVASQIDAPRPQGRIDSVVSHLDAQAVAAEHNRQYVTNWQNTSDDHDGEALPYDHQHPYTTYGLGLQGIHVPINMALPGLNGLYPYPSSTHSFTDSHSNENRHLMHDGIDQSRTTLGSPFSPGLDKDGHQF